MAAPVDHPALACTAPFGFDTDPAQTLAAFSALGCRACQYYRKIPDPLDAGARRRSVDVPRALVIAADAGMRFDSIHGVFGESIDPSSSDLNHRLACVEVYDDEASIALELGGSMIVVHPGAINPGKRALSDADAAGSQAARTPFLDDFLARLAEVGERRGVTFLVENLPFSCTFGFDPVLLAERTRRVGSRSVSMCFDTGHALITARTRACPDAATVHEAFTKCADVVGYIHVHDNDAAADLHRAPGDGVLDWDAFGAALRASGSAAPRMLELFHSPPQLAALARAGLSGKLASWLSVKA